MSHSLPSVIIRCKVQRLPAFFLITGSHENEHSHPCQASIPTDDTVIHWRHTLAAQEAGQKTAALEHRRLWGVTASCFLPLQSGKLQWMSVCRITARIWGQEHPQSAIQNRQASHQHVEVICLIGGSFFSILVYFRCGMAGVPGSCLGPDT